MQPLLLPEARHWADESEVAGYASACMQTVGLEKWTFGWDRAIRRLGCCRPGSRSVTLSIHFVRKYLELDQGQIRRTLLHELAHALAWEFDHSTGHGPTWHAFCQVLGVGEEKSHVRCEDFTPADRRPRKPRYALCHKETGEVFHHYYSFPRRSVAQIGRMYIRGRKAETMGKLCILPVEDC